MALNLLPNAWWLVWPVPYSVCLLKYVHRDVVWEADASQTLYLLPVWES